MNNIRNKILFQIVQKIADFKIGKKLLENSIKIIDFFFSREVGIELVKVSLTALFGLFTFKIYQMYRNKEDNSKLYIQMIKLEKEMIGNQEILRKIIDNHSKYTLLNKVFRGESSREIYKLYKLVDSLNNYVQENISYEKGEPVDSEYIYTEKPYDLINHLNVLSSQIEFEGKDHPENLASIHDEIKKLERSSIFNLLIEVEEKSRAIEIKGHEIQDSIQYLIIRLEEFNSKEYIQKKKNLDEFCSQLFDGANIFSSSLKQFRNYKTLSNKIHKGKKNKKSPEKFGFKVWKQQEMELLGVYSSEDYLALENYYYKNRNIEISDWEIEKAKILFEEMQAIYDERILVIRNVLKKTLNRTNWIFGKI